MEHLPAVAEESAGNDNFYNTVFEQLCDGNAGDAEQLIGIVAYGIYKIGKREWVLEFIEENQRRPTPDEYRAHAKGQTQTVLDGYRSNALRLVSAYSSAAIERERPNIVADARKGTFKRAVWSSYVASAAFAASLIGLYFLLLFMGVPLPR